MAKKQFQVIEKRISEDKQRILENLKKVPIVSVACQKSGVSRSSFYRWKSKDRLFSKQANEALKEGKQLINDMAESQLVSAIKDQNMTAIIYWLRNNHSGYADRVELTHKTEKEELSPQQEKLIKKAIALTQGNSFGKLKNEK